MNQDYTIKELTEKEFLPLLRKHRKSVFAKVHSYTLLDLLKDAEQKNMQELQKKMGSPYKLYLGAFDRNNKFVGWSWGQQESKSTFYMVNSGVLQKHRRKGLYSALLHKCVDIVSKKGFQLIYSRHCATNNDVIIPKLKAGFIISKMEMDDIHGILIHLHFYINKTRRKIMDYRAGQLKPDTKIKEIFKL